MPCLAPSLAPVRLLTVASRGEPVGRVVGWSRDAVGEGPGERRGTFPDCPQAWCAHLGQPAAALLVVGGDGAGPGGAADDEAGRAGRTRRLDLRREVLVAGTAA